MGKERTSSRTQRSFGKLWIMFREEKAAPVHRSLDDVKGNNGAQIREL